MQSDIYLSLKERQWIHYRRDKVPSLNIIPTDYSQGRKTRGSLFLCLLKARLIVHPFMGQYVHMCEWRVINMSAVWGSQTHFCEEFSECLQISHSIVWSFFSDWRNQAWVAILSKPLTVIHSADDVILALSFWLLEHLFAISLFEIVFKICIEWHRQGIRTPSFPLWPDYVETGFMHGHVQ